MIALLTVTLFLSLTISWAEIVKAYNSKDVEDLLYINKDKVVSLFFINPNTSKGKEEKVSFWQSVLNVIDSVKGIFIS